MMEDSNDLRRQFADPPAEFRPLIIQHSQPLSSLDALESLVQRDAGGSVINGDVAPGSNDQGGEKWNNPTYLRDEERMRRLKEIIGRIRDQGRRVWIYDELGYPSGSAGGRTLEGHPEYQVLALGCRSFSANGGQRLSLAVENGDCYAAFALPARDGVVNIERSVDLSDRLDGRQSFEWTCPSGEWVVDIYERFYPDTWERHNIRRRNINILDRRAVARFIELTHARYESVLADSLKQVDAFFTDEPQFGAAEHWSGGLPHGVPMVQWLDDFPALFRRTKGYDLRPLLPALFHPAGARTAKIRFDFYDVQSELVAENYFGQIEQWLHGRGVASSGHMLLEESLLFHVMFSGSMMKNWARMDLPGVDLLRATPYHTMGGWYRKIMPVAEDFSNKMASSVAHLEGKRGVFSESFALADKANLRQVLGIAAWQFAGGITHMATYTIQDSLPAPDYARFSDFAGRLAVLTRRGVHVAPVAVLVPEAAVWAAYNPPDGGTFPRYFERNPDVARIDCVFRDVCHALLEAQCDFDTVGENHVERAVVSDGRMRLADESFCALLLPESRCLRSETLAKARSLLASGGLVAFVGSLPRQTPAQGDDTRITSDAQRLLAEFPERAVLIDYPAGVERVAAWLRERLPPSARWEGPSAVRLLQRGEPNRRIFLLANPSENDATGVLIASASGQASIWDPETGTIADRGPVSDGQPISVALRPCSALCVAIETDRRPRL